MIKTVKLWINVEVSEPAAIGGHIALVDLTAVNFDVAREFVLTCHTPERPIADNDAVKMLIRKGLVQRVDAKGLAVIHRDTRAVVEAATMVICDEWTGEIRSYAELF